MLADRNSTPVIDSDLLVYLHLLPVTHAEVLATPDRTALLLADSPTPMESTAEEASEEAKDQSEHN